MKHIVLGTAGHVDHGKTLLTKALTGVDTDKLAEEKARGITIELGFAKLKLGDGVQVSIVDVPGHEKFVKTMMAGASGLDGVMLVVAADDGVMPQTVEHLDILRLLRIPAGLIVITKIDLVSQERLDEVKAQCRQLTEGCFLENAPIVPVSAAEGTGIEELRGELRRLVDGLRQRNTEQPLRLPVDRVFQVSGFGNVASGTLTEGLLKVGDTVELYPAGVTGSIRTLQNHNKSVELSQAGMRTALSMNGDARDALARGVTLAEPESMAVAEWLDVHIQLTESCPYTIRNSSQLHFFQGTREVVCKLRLLNADKLTAGMSGYAQLNLAEPVAVRNGDRFLLRFFSPVLTIGGGVVLAANDHRLRRNRPEVLERLERLNCTELPISLCQRVADSGLQPVNAELLRKRCNLAPEPFQRAFGSLVEAGEVVEIGTGSWITAKAVGDCAASLSDELTRYHETYPLQPGMPVPEVRSRFFGKTVTGTDQVLLRMSERGLIELKDGFVSIPGFVPIFTQEHKIMQRKLLHYYRDAWFIAPNLRDVNEKFEKRGEIYPQVLANMKLNGMLIPLTPRYLVHHEAYEEALKIFRGLFERQERVSLGEFRTAANISRKYAQLFLEYWDRAGISRRIGDVRVLLDREE